MFSGFSSNMSVADAEMNLSKAKDKTWRLSNQLSNLGLGDSTGIDTVYNRHKRAKAEETIAELDLDNARRMERARRKCS